MKVMHRNEIRFRVFLEKIRFKVMESREVVLIGFSDFSVIK
jgi:muramoyltetrapeptide carboxypeptidase LdcA involved in peptidoglycan recycling